MKKILVVDDQKDICDLIKERLIQNNFSVLVASNGQDAVELSRSEHPDLILLDVAMPDLDGYQTCEMLKGDKATKDIPIIFLTGKDLDELAIKKRCETLCANGYISKLSSLNELLDKVKGALFRDSA